MAATDYASVVQQLYVSYFGRPADVNGLQNFENALLAINAPTDFVSLNAAVQSNSNPALTALVNTFNNSAESQHLYGTDTSELGVQKFVNAIYNNVLNRDADSSGFTFWVNAITSGTLSRADAAMAISQAAIDGAGNSAQAAADALTVENKLAVATDFTSSLDTPVKQIAYSGDTAAATAAALLKQVTSTTDVTAFHANVVATEQGLVSANTPSTTLTLTANPDTLVGGAGNDTFLATGTTLSALDSLDGGAGNNTLIVTDATGVLNTTLPAGITLKNIQTMNVTTVKSLGQVAAAATTGTPGTHEVDKVDVTGTDAGGQTYNVTYGGVTTTTGSVTSDAAANVAIANAINAIAGSTIATVVGADIILTSSAAGAALPAFNITSNGLGGVVVTPQQAATAPTTGTAATTAALFDISGLGVTTFNATSTGGDNLNAGAATNVTVTDSANGTTSQVAGGNNVTIIENGTAGAVIVDGAAGATVVTQNTAGSVTVGANTASTGTVTVTDGAQVGAISVDGGTAVTITANNTTSTGTITVGSNTAATGAVAVSTTVAGAAGTSSTIGTITVTGGTSINVTESATEAVKTVTAGNGTVTQGAVHVFGKTGTTSVTVNQSAAVVARGTTVAIAGATETVAEKFAAGGLTAGQGITIGGLSFIASGTMTAAQVAAAFANLTAGATQGNSTLGVYTGTLLGFTSGPVTGTATDTVSFVSTAANTVTGAPAVALNNGAPAPTATVTTTGAAATAAVSGRGGISGGAVTVLDNHYGVSANSITSATLSGYLNATVSSDALTSLSLANANGAVVVNNHTASTLALSLNGVGTSVSGTTLNLDGGTAGKYTTLNITTATADSVDAVTATGVQALTIGGSKAVDLTGSTFTALKTVTVTGSAGVTLDASGANVTDVNAAATSGTTTFALDATKATFEGGSGADTLNVIGNISKAISLGAGNDTLNLGSGAVITAVVTGGAGTDTLGMTAADAVANSASAVFATKVSGFEALIVGAGTGAQTVHVDTLGNFNAVSTGAEANAGVLTFDGFTSGGSLTLTSGAVGTGSYVVSSASFTTPTTDVFNVALTNAASAGFGTVTANSIETINLSSTDTNVLHTTVTNNNALSLSADSVTKIVITGNTNLNLGITATTLTSVDATALTGGLTYTTASTVAEVVKGGAGANFLTAHAGSTGDTLIGGASADVLTANAGSDILTGGAGADKFVITTPSTSVNTYATITDASVGDTLQFTVHGADVFNSTKVVLANTAVFQDYANAVIAAGANSAANGHIGWFQFAGDTYVVESLHDATGGATSFINGTDAIVKLTGTVDLSHTSVNSALGTLLIG